MTFAEMTPESARLLVCIAGAVVLPWCWWLLHRAIWKDKKKPHDGHTSREFDGKV